MRTLDRTLFRKKILIAAAKVHEHDQIHNCRSYLGADVLKIPSRPSVITDPKEQGLPKAKKMILLQPPIQPKGSMPIEKYGSQANKSTESSWSQKLRDLVEQQKVAVSPYELNLSYEDWDYCKTTLALPAIF